VSVISQVTGDRCARLVRAATTGDLASARELYNALLPAVRAIMTRTQGAIMAKAALQLQGVIASRATRAPLVDATEEQVAVLRADLGEAL
jgi:4-hydroxy-tetrahydrodipicolinate synthase